ncbi:MAG TPA: DUF3784 domain-containing protein [Candidatus Alectryocaccobium stercorigallinarum]|nr:DUF3784 domain-containing protein [Candidatus Alectryocaccobium stercorigallinarum]
MLSDEFSMIIGVICLVLAVVFFLGKGAGVISAFEGKNAPIKKKKSPEDERRYQRAFGIFCLVLACGEFLNIVLPPHPAVGIVTIAIVVVDLVFIVIYLKKNFPDG